MELQSIAALIGEAPEEASKSNDALGRQDFLRMLIAQLENQDPLDPQNASEFSAQLAQFSSLEQLLDISQSFDDLATSQGALSGSIQNLAATNLIGREAQVRGSSFEVASDGLLFSTPSFELAGAATETEVVVRNSDGATVLTEQLGALVQGFHEIPPSILIDAGLNQGTYSFEVVASNGNEAVATTPYFSGPVTGAVRAGADTLVQLGGIAVPYADIAEVRQGGGSR